ncbi:DapH/DapD/GlmU-related protein [Sulfurovum sp.]|uniref:acyltransferase n=1 Tax=Sulfurovum sp. TaxID=1969726 RepID=UPI0035615FB3
MRDILRKIFNKLFPQQDTLSLLIERGLVVGKNFSMQNEVIIDPNHCWHITIGDNVTLAPRVYILAHDASTKRSLNYTRIGKVKIGDNVFIGASSTVLPGVIIGNNVIVGAGSIVVSDIPDNSIVVGNPAKVIDTYDNYMKKRKDEMSAFPCFGEEYTIRKNVSSEMQNEMNEKMTAKFGYLV